MSIMSDINYISKSYTRGDFDPRILEEGVSDDLSSHCVDYSSLPIAKLREELQYRGLQITGRKSMMVWGCACCRLQIVVDTPFIAH